MVVRVPLSAVRVARVLIEQYMYFAGYVQSKENPDVYSTTEPLTAFHQRISFCLDIHNSSVKAMRFPPKSYNKDLESADERREREQLELESAKEIADEDFDGY